MPSGILPAITTIQRSAASQGKKVLAVPDEVGDSEGLYWKYESFLKRQDSAFYSVVGAAGELFSVRANLYEPLPHHIILDDFVLSLSIAQKGYRILYEPDAYAMELPSFSIGDEQKRKVRIAAGGSRQSACSPPCWHSGDIPNSPIYTFLTACSDGPLAPSA